jgi:hypothetical protein
MIKKITLALFIICSLVACNSKNAFNYSQDFVKKEKSLEPSILQTEKNMEAFIAAEKYDSVVVAAELMENKVQVVIAELDAIPAPDVEEGQKFKVDIKKYFEFIKSIYTNYKMYGKATDQVARDVQLERLQTLVAKGQEATNTMIASQASFAKANGFKLESSK